VVVRSGKGNIRSNSREIDVRRDSRQLRVVKLRGAASQFDPASLFPDMVAGRQP